MKVQLFRNPREHGEYSMIGNIHMEEDAFGGSINCPILTDGEKMFADLSVVMVHVPSVLKSNELYSLSQMINTIADVTLWILPFQNIQENAKQLRDLVNDIELVD